MTISLFGLLRKVLVAVYFTTRRHIRLVHRSDSIFGFVLHRRVGRADRSHELVRVNYSKNVGRRAGIRIKQVTIKRKLTQSRTLNT